MTTNFRDRTAIVGVGNSKYERLTSERARSCRSSRRSRTRSTTPVSSAATSTACWSTSARRSAWTTTRWPRRSASTSTSPTRRGRMAGRWRPCSRMRRWRSTRASRTMWRACARSTGRAPARSGTQGQFQDDREIGGAHFEHPHYGMTSPGGAWAMGARKYFDRYGATSRDLAEVCVSTRNHALLQSGRGDEEAAHGRAASGVALRLRAAAPATTTA